MRPPTEDVAGVSEYRYRCTHDHESGSRRPLTRCPAFRKGQPCDGTLERFGKGSQGPRKGA